MAFCRRFSVKCTDSNPLAALTPLDLLLLWGVVLPPFPGISGSAHFISLCFSPARSCRLPGWLRTGILVLSGLLRAWRLRRPDCLAQFASAFSASSMLPRFSGVAPSTICWSSIRCSCDGSVPA